MNTVLRTFRASLTAGVRRKQIVTADLETNKLKRCLSAFELTLFGVGATIGPGLYVISGQVARETAGPGVVASYAIAALACLFSAVCYAEFAVRLPRAGSSYTYCYATVGELIGFVVGWNVIFENIVGFAVVAKAWSQYLDSFLNNTIQTHLEQDIIPGHRPIYFDVVAFSLVLLFTIVVVVGAQVTSTANIAFTAVNMFVSILIIGFGSFYVNPKNWSNFAPFGLSGIIRGSGKCFYSMLGFDVVATTCEETEDKKTVPKAMLLTLLTCFVLYFSTSAILTLIVPWYELDINAAFPIAFASLGLTWAKYVIVVGAISSLSASILGGLYAAARVTYSMALDGLIFRVFGCVSDRFRTPVFATIIVGTIGALMALIFDLVSLVEMMSIGTLTAYTGVSASVLILRHQPWTIGYTLQDEEQDSPSSTQREESAETDRLLLKSPSATYGNNSLALVTKKNAAKINQLKAKIAAILDEQFGFSLKHPSEQSGGFACNLTAIYASLIIIIAIFVNNSSTAIASGAPWVVAVFCFLVGLLLVTIICFILLPRNGTKLHFTVPYVTAWCLVAIGLNLTIMMTLSAISWIRTVVWLFIGLTIYFLYGARNSCENQSAASGTTDDSGEHIEMVNKTDENVAK